MGVSSDFFACACHGQCSGLHGDVVFLKVELLATALSSYHKLAPVVLFGLGISPLDDPVFDSVEPLSVVEALFDKGFDSFDCFGCFVWIEFENDVSDGLVDGFGCFGIGLSLGGVLVFVFRSTANSEDGDEETSDDVRNHVLNDTVSIEAY